MHTPYKYNIYHPNGKGNGSSLSLELYTANGPNVGKVILSFARQVSVGSEVDGRRTFPRFDWANQVAIRLEPTEIEKMLEVFAGETESINDGKGLVDLPNITTFYVRHSVEPVPHYVIEIVKAEGEAKQRRVILLSPTEARTLYDGLTAAMGALVFGV